MAESAPPPTEESAPEPSVEMDTQAGGPPELTDASAPTEDPPVSVVCHPYQTATILITDHV
jgi:hypothetical protein